MRKNHTLRAPNITCGKAKDEFRDTQSALLVRTDVHTRQTRTTCGAHNSHLRCAGNALWGAKYQLSQRKTCTYGAQKMHFGGAPTHFGCAGIPTLRAQEVDYGAQKISLLVRKNTPWGRRNHFGAQEGALLVRHKVHLGSAKVHFSSSYSLSSACSLRHPP